MSEPFAPPAQPLGRLARYVTRGAPIASPLNGEWVRVDADLELPPQFVKREAPDIAMFYTGCAWRICRGAGVLSAGEILAEAPSTALHPSTVGASSWRFAVHGLMQPACEFEVISDGPNTEQEPFQMEELGRDFFLRVQLTRKVVWFVCPATGNVYHSAAKPGGPGGRAKPGKRYCHLCKKCFSANNFQSQHLANLHRPGRPSGLVTVRDGSAAVHLLWRSPPDASACGPAVTGFRVRVSVDDGASWQCGIEDTGTSETRAIITNLIPGVQYRFQVAGVNCAGVGADSEPSPSLCIAPVAPPITTRVSEGLDLLSMAAANRMQIEDGAGLLRQCHAETKVARSLSEGHCPTNMEAIRHVGSFDVF